MMWVAPAPHFDLTTFILLKDIYIIRKNPQNVCFVIFGKLSKLNNRPMGEKSPNLVTVDVSRSFIALLR
jgi:hypothetical protein